LFRINVELENAAAPGKRIELKDVLVDTGAELSWFPSAMLEALGIERRKQLRFRQADGTILTRWTGAASMYVDERWTVDEVVFGEATDMVLLGARSLEGLNVRVDPIRKTLVDAGPAPAAAAV
jgi:predicted aspartyl protease